MTTSKVISKVSLPQASTRNNAPATSEVASSIAGRSRYLWEMAHGASAVVGEPPAIGRNPQGLVGVDFSGPPFGACQLLPVAWWQGKSGGAGVVSPGNKFAAVDGTKVSLPPWSIKHRRHVVHVDDAGPLQQLGLLWRATAGAGTSSVYEITINNVTSGREVTTSQTINTTTETTYLTADLFPMVPGENVLIVSAQRISGTRVLNLQSLTLVVVAKRKHGLTFPG